MTYLVYAVANPCGYQTGRYNGILGWSKDRTTQGKNVNEAFVLCEGLRKSHNGCKCVFEVVESECKT